MPFLPECRLVIPAGARLRCGNSPPADELFYAAAALRRVGCPYRFSPLAPGYPPSATQKICTGPTPSADYRRSLRSPWPAAVESCPTALGNELF